MVVANIAYVCALLNWLYRVFINYATGYMPVHIWNFCIEITVCKYCIS